MTAAEKVQTIPTDLPPWKTEIAFDTRNKKQVEEAKALYQQAKLAGRAIKTNGNDAFNFRVILEQGFMQIEPEGHGNENLLALHIIDKTGDRRPIWRMDDPEEVEKAAELFNEYIKKGWKAYAVHRSDPNKKGVRVYEFDPTLEEVIFDDVPMSAKIKNFADAMVKNEIKKAEDSKSKVKQKIKKFARSFSEIKMLPKTVPG